MMAFLEKIQNYLTLRVYLKSNKRNFLRMQEYKLPNKTTIKAYVFEKENELFLGQATIFGTIIANNVINGFSDNARDYVLLHELGHQKLNPLLSIPLLILVIPAFFLAFLGPIIAGLLAIFFLVQLDSFNFIVAILGGLITLLPFICIQFLSEGHAEYFAIKTIKVNNFLKARSEIKTKRKHIRKTIFDKILIRLSYPPDSWIIKIYKLIENHKVQQKNEFG